jgi:hypothetical protein
MSVRGAGGTSGGIGQFFLGVAMAGAGLYMFMSRVSVMSSFRTLFGVSHFGLILIPLGIGVAFLFFNGRSIIGWLLTVGCLAAVLVSVISNLRFFFMPTNLFITIAMISLIFIGFGMILRSLKDFGSASERKSYAILNDARGELLDDEDAKPRQYKTPS